MNLARFGTEVLFSGTDASGGVGLWETDGTSAGTSELTATGAFNLGLDPVGFIALGNRVLFQGAAPCFARGTRIATERGDIAVEQLHVGDQAVMIHGEARPIVWIGERRVDCRRHPQPELVRPVRIRAEAFGEGEPRRDLLLSPDHAVFREGVLIPVRHLVNGASIVQARVDAVHYFHVELDRHDVLLAEGLPVESYLDTGNRAQFANGRAHVALHPDFSPLSWEHACAPLCTNGRALGAVRQHLLDRVCGAAGLRIIAGAKTVRAAAVKCRLHRFVLPANSKEIQIASPVTRDDDSGTARFLGVCLDGIVVDRKPVALDSPLLADGFHPLERRGTQSWRWIDGAARLVLPGASSRPVVLELHLMDSVRSLIGPERAALPLAS